MEIKFNVHGQQRKKLVEQIAEYTQQKAEYQYTPTYAYQIGKYTISKDGNLLSPDEIPAGLVTHLKQQGFTPSETVKLNITYRRNEFTDQVLDNRSEERRVGKECSSRWQTSPAKQKY